MQLKLKRVEEVKDGILVQISLIYVMQEALLEMAIQLLMHEKNIYIH